MLSVWAAPPQAAAWIEGLVAMRLGTAQRLTQFPALPHAMLTVQLLPAPRAGAAALCGPVAFHTLSTVPMRHGHAGGITALGLLVRPAAAACLLGRACGAQVDQVLRWSVIAGESEGARLDDALDRAPDHRTRLRELLSSFGRAMAAAAPARHEDHLRLCEAVGRHGAQAGALLGLGPRQLQRRCQAVLGLSPKPFQRLVRFHRVLGDSVACAALPPQGLAMLALEGGYFDQSHLARESRLLAGASLGALRSAARPDSAWWPLMTRQHLGRAPEQAAAHGPRAAFAPGAGAAFVESAGRPGALRAISPGGGSATARA